MKYVGRSERSQDGPERDRRGAWLLAVGIFPADAVPASRHSWLFVGRTTPEAGARRTMRYEGKLYRPPSEARSYILQATIGCSHNLCTYCDMYRDRTFRERELVGVLEDVAEAGRVMPGTERVFVADGDALIMDVPRWLTSGSLRAPARAGLPARVADPL